VCLHRVPDSFEQNIPRGIRNRFTSWSSLPNLFYNTCLSRTTSCSFYIYIYILNNPFYTCRVQMPYFIVSVRQLKTSQALSALFFLSLLYRGFMTNLIKPLSLKLPYNRHIYTYISISIYIHALTRHTKHKKLVKRTKQPVT
jgi:hypothetical protein